MNIDPRIAQLILSRYSDKKIAEELAEQVTLVRKARRDFYAFLGVRSCKQALIEADRRGMIVHKLPPDKIRRE